MTYTIYRHSLFLFLLFIIYIYISLIIPLPIPPLHQQTGTPPDLLRDIAMAQQEDGWPLGLHPLNVRVGLVRSRDLSFSTLLTRSTTSSADSSSDLDTESTGSFFRDNSITLGSLIGISSVLELSRRSTRGRVTETTIRKKKSYKSRTWLFSLCSKLSTDAVSISNNPQSLGHFLQAERQASNMYRRDQSPTNYGLDDFSHTLPASDGNSLFLEGHIAPPQSSQDGDRISGGLVQNDRYGTSMIFSRLCGNLTQ